jgi:hypothetical protein
MTDALRKNERPQKRGECDTRRTEVARGAVVVPGGMQEQHGEHQDHKDQDDRAEHRVSATALERAPKPNHEGRDATGLPCRRHLSASRQTR